MIFTKIFLMGYLTWNGICAQETSNRESYILADLLSLPDQVESLAKDIEEVVASVAEKVPNLEVLTLPSESNYWEMLEKSGEMMISNRNCEPLKNTFEMMTTNIKAILKQCFQRATSFVQELFTKITSLRSSVSECKRWTVLRSLSLDRGGNKTEQLLSQIASIKTALDKLKATKNIKEMESNVSLRICESVADSYEEEGRNLLNQIKECLFPQSTDEVIETTSSKTIADPSTSSDTSRQSTDAVYTRRRLTDGWMMD